MKRLFGFILVAVFLSILTVPAFAIELVWEDNLDEYIEVLEQGPAEQYRYHYGEIVLKIRLKRDLLDYEKAPLSGTLQAISYDKDGFEIHTTYAIIDEGSVEKGALKKISFSLPPAVKVKRLVIKDYHFNR